MSKIPSEFKAVTALTKANIYFDGKVVSHSILFADGSKKTLGLIYPGQYHFGTDKSECMEIVAGQCTVKLDGATATANYTAGQAFVVPAKSGFDITVPSGICEYICSFLGLVVWGEASGLPPVLPETDLPSASRSLQPHEC